MEGYTIPDTEKVLTESNSYAMTDYATYYARKNYKGIEYQPKIIREKLQISLWRMDAYGVVKTKDRYFTPTHERFKSSNFGNFQIYPSLDKETIVLVETLNSGESEALVVVLDANNLKVISEQTLSYKDSELQVPDTDYYDEYYDDFGSSYPTSQNSPNIICWNKGRYILFGVSKPGVLCTYAYKLLDTEAKKVVKTIKRDGALKKHVISDFKVDPENQEILYVTAYNYNEGVVARISLSDGKISTVSTTQFNNPELPGFYFLNESCTKVVIGAVCYSGNKRMFKILTYGINDSPKVDASVPKNQKDCIDSKSFSRMNGNNLISICNNELNVLEARCTGQVNFKKSA